MEAAGREAPAAPAAEALLPLGSDVRVGVGRDHTLHSATHRAHDLHPVLR